MTEKQDVIISHVRPTDQAIQTNEEHSQNVAALSSQFAAEFGMADWGQFIGQLHDKGKERNDFQNYIRRENGMEAPTYDDKTHAWIGAILAKQIAPNLYPIATFQILGHHTGLCDYTKLSELDNKEIPSEVDSDIHLQEPSLDFFKNNNLFLPDRQKHLHHVIRMLFSCLVDADFLDTEQFMQPEKSIARSNDIQLTDLLPKLESFLSSLKADTPVNKIRKKIQNCCRAAADKPKGVYSLTVPTGGGKTLSSLLWAMLHAIKNGQHRIIIAIPYTSIISQTAKTFKDIFGEEAVLEHHSNYDYHDREEKYDDINPERMATENWDAPIIVTTNVQLFESMYASHPGRCRKLHNIANSVIILDEVQTLPGEHLQAIVDALKAYNELFGVSLLFTTASQPTLEGERKGHEQNLQGFDKIEELIPDTMQLHDKLRRVKLDFIDTALSYEDIAEQMMRYERVLCIVNTRQAAADLFNHLPQNENHYHLSRNMCPEHVDSTLQTIKARLKENDDQPIRVVTTQLIEAGVDIDFPVVMRQEIGLDSILQAAGRCNREGKMTGNGTTYVFKIDGVNVPRGTMSYANDARLNMRPQEDLFTPDAMTEYFTQYYAKIPSFDKKDKEGNCIQNLLHKADQLLFDSADQYFKLIEDNGYPVVVNFQDSSTLVNEMRYGNVSKKMYRKLARYTITIPRYLFDKLNEIGIVEKIESQGKETGLYYISDKKLYDEHYGLSHDVDFQNEMLII